MKAGLVISLPSNFTGRLPPACDTHAIIPICVPPSSALPVFLFLPARIGHCCHSSPAIRSQGDLSFTEYSLALLASAQCALPLLSLGSSAVWALIDSLRAGRSGQLSRWSCLRWQKSPRSHLPQALLQGFRGSQSWLPSTSRHKLLCRAGCAGAAFQFSAQ